MSTKAGMNGNKGRAELYSDLDLNGARLAIVASRFNAFIVDRLVIGAMQTLRKHDIAVDTDATLYVPGAFELPLAVQSLAEKDEFDGIIALGAVIRGETAHFDYVCSECASGLMQVALKYDLPVGFGVLTVDNEEQALARAGDTDDNKGVEAAQAVLEMIALLRRIRT